MPANVMDQWLNSGKKAAVGQMLLRPREHTILRGMPLSVQRGQAEAFCLEGQSGDVWFLKKFYDGRRPDRSYLEGTSRAVPHESAFRAATERSVLTGSDLKRSFRTYYNRAFAKWLHDTLLMPCVSGTDWSALADDIRNGDIALDTEHRAQMASNLAATVALLEQSECAHRDLSSGNVFVNTSDLTVNLIDFDSLYHPTLSIPNATTCGTVGYVASFVWKNGSTDASETWCQQADRFSLAILTAEFLVLDRGAPITADGGMCDQDEIARRSGPGLSQIRKQLQHVWKEAVPLYDSALTSQSFQNCPSPADWIECLSGRGIPTPVPISDLVGPTAEDFATVFAKLGPTEPVCQAPSLAELPAPSIQPPSQKETYVELPPNPWDA